MASAANTLTNPNYRPDIDGLRSIAILAVVLFHAFPDRLRGGYIGVDIFFVISGYLISGIIFRGLEREQFSLLDFYRHRVKRIFPSLITMLVTVCTFSWFFLLPEEFAQLGKHIFSSVFFFQNITLWNEAGYFDTTSELKPLMHLWSLAVEEQFYLFFPLIAIVARRKRCNMLHVLVCAFLLSFVLNIVFVTHYPTAAFFLPHTRVWELLAGSLLAYGQLACRGDLELANTNTGFLHRLVRALGAVCSIQWARNFVAATGFLLLLAGIFGLNKGKVFPGWWALAPVSGAVMVIAAGPQAWVNRTLLASSVMVFIGLISYPLYLWHWPFLSLAHVVGTETPSTLLSCLLVASSTVMAWLTYRFVELPLRFGLPKIKKEYALIGTMLILAGFGSLVQANDGVATRFPNASRMLTQPIDFKWYDFVRTGKCHLQDGDTLHHDSSCYEHGHPSVVLWGDSHAASLYPGLHQLQIDNGFSLTQLTTAACPPFLGAAEFNPKARENCGKLNELVLTSLLQDPPDVLVLHSVFQSEHQFIWPTQTVINKVSETLNLVRSKLHGTKIVLIGPMPRWHESPQKTSFLRWRESLYNGTPLQGPGPLRQNATLLSELDNGLARVAQDKGVTYISALQVLCNTEGCISRVGEIPEQFIAIDYGHLSKAGSEFFAHKISQTLLGLLSPQ